MRHLRVSGFTLGVTLSAASGALASTEALDRLATRAQSVRREAEDARRVRTDRKSDLSVVTQRATVLESHARALKDALAAASSSDASHITAAHGSWQRARAATDTLPAPGRGLVARARAPRWRGLRGDVVGGACRVGGTRHPGCRTTHHTHYLEWDMTWSYHVGTFRGQGHS